MEENIDNDDVGVGGGVQVNESLRRAKAKIQVGEMEKGRTFLLIDYSLVLDRVNAQYLVQSLQEFTRDGTVTGLNFTCSQYTREAVMILREYFRTTTLSRVSLGSCEEGFLGNDLGGQLLSGLHENASVTFLELDTIGLDGGRVGGEIISGLLARMRNLTILHCWNAPLRLEGAQQLQAGIRASPTLERLKLHACELGDEGVRLLVEAVEEGNTNNTITHVDLSRNELTSASLPHLTQLLEHESIKSISLCENDRLFDDVQATCDFFGSAQKELRLSHRDLPQHALDTLFQALDDNDHASSTAIKSLGICDIDELRGAKLHSLIQSLPTMGLERLNVNVDLSNPDFLLALRQNLTICHVYNGWVFPYRREIKDGSIGDVTQRNQRFRLAKQLVPYEAEQIQAVANETTNDDAMVVAATNILFKKIWSWILTERLLVGQQDDDNNNNSNRCGATAVFFALREKMAMWIDDHA